MSHAGHYISKCWCGAVVNQCRCADPNKTVHHIKNLCKECQKKCDCMNGILRVVCRHCDEMRKKGPQGVQSGTTVNVDFGACRPDTDRQG